MGRSGIVERWQLLHPGMIAALVAGTALGGWAGATFKGSGMFYSNVILAGGLLLLLALSGLGALLAARTGERSRARIMAGFVGMTVIATGVAFAVAPPFRSAGAPLIHEGNATVNVAEPTALEVHGKATCKQLRDRPLFIVYMPDVRSGDKDVAVLLNLSPGSPPVHVEKVTIVYHSPEVLADYIASPGQGLDAMVVGADGLTGTLRFSAALVPVAGRSPDPDVDRLSGTFEWACSSAPSGRTHRCLSGRFSPGRPLALPIGQARCGP